MIESGFDLRRDDGLVVPAQALELARAINLAALPRLADAAQLLDIHAAAFVDRDGGIVDARAAG